MLRDAAMIGRSTRAAHTCVVLRLLWLCGGWLLIDPAAQTQAQGAMPPAPTGEVNEAQRGEARWRFDRGIALYNEGDYAGALIEFERAYRLTGHDAVRFNIGLVHAKLGDSVAAVEALEPLLQASSALGPERLERARQAYDEHRERIGALKVETNVPGTIVRVDNIDVAKAPTPPIKLNAGAHVVSVLAPGYEPRRLLVSVAGRAEEKVELELLPLEEHYAQLTITTSVPDVEVYEGEERLGTAPFAATLAFKPGLHELSFRRPGYRSEQRTLNLHAGSTGQVDVTMVIDERAPEIGVLSVGVQEAQSVVWIDEQPRVDFAEGMRLPVGRHRMRVERKGFHELSRDVVVQAAPSRVEVELFPTADYLADYVGGAQLQRTLAWVSLGAGAAIAIGGGAYLVYNQGKKDDAKADFDRVAEENDTGLGTCDDVCKFAVNDALDKLEQARDRDLYGWLGVGIGGAALVTGVVLYLTGDDPGRYDASDEADVLGGFDLRVAPGGASLSGRF